MENKELTMKDLSQVTAGLTQEEIDKYIEQTKAQLKNDSLNQPDIIGLDLPKMEQGLEPAERNQSAPKLESSILIPSGVQDFVNAITDATDVLIIP